MVTTHQRDSCYAGRPPVSITLLLVVLAFSVCCSRPPQRNPTVNKPPTNAAQTLVGRVIRVADGDTITILDSTNTQHRIRLQGIDAPESHQAFGTQSKKSLSDMIFDNDVTVIYEKTDRYGRVVGKIL